MGSPSTRARALRAGTLPYGQNDRVRSRRFPEGSNPDITGVLILRARATI
jgi:hypothetical protein